MTRSDAIGRAAVRSPPRARGPPPPQPLLHSVEVSGTVAGAASVQGSWPSPTTTVAKPKHATSFTVADAIVPLVQLYSAPNVPVTDGAVTVPMHSGTVMF